MEIQNNPVETAAGKDTDMVFVKLNRRSITPVSFALVIVCFFFTFFNFKCQNTLLVSVSGMNLVTGTSFEKEEVLSKGELKNNRLSPNAWAIIALAAAATGLGVYLLRNKKEALIGSVAGAVAVISLVILQFDIHNMVKVKESTVYVEFTAAYWIAICLSVIASFLSFSGMKKRTE